MPRNVSLAALLFAALCSPLAAQIYRWDNGQVIPGTEAITPRPGVQLDHRNLEFANLERTDLTKANLELSNLSNATLYESTLTNADLAGAKVAGAFFDNTIGFTQDQLYSTASYQLRDLHGIWLTNIDLRAWNFADQNLTNAVFRGSNLEGANLAGAVVAGAELATYLGVTKEQVYSTASYRDREFRGTQLKGDFTGWNFSGQNLTRVNFGPFGDTLAIVTDADMTGADLRGSPLNGSMVLTNTILPDGSVLGLDLIDDELVIRDDDPWLAWKGITHPPIPVKITERLSIAQAGKVLLRLDADPWDSLISFEPGIPVQLGGTLELTFAKDVDPAGQVGRTLDLFDWTGVSPTGAFSVSSLYSWDLSRLYTTGEVTLLAADGAIAGDSTGDGQVTLVDFGILKDNFGAAGNLFQGDANGDGRIDLSDFGLLKANFGKSANNVAAPEPSGFAMAAAGLLTLAVLAKWRRRSVVEMYLRAGSLTLGPGQDLPL